MAVVATEWSPAVALPRLRPFEIEAAAERLESCSAQEVLAWAVATFGDHCAIVTSFQREGMAILDMALRLDRSVRVLTIDTGRLPAETYEMIDTVRARYGVEVEVIAPDTASLEAMQGLHGPNLFRRDRSLRRLCCHIRKVEPLERALEGLGAWATGLRRDGGLARAGIAKVELDEAHGGIVKLNPLADWTRERVVAYTTSRNLPEHPLYAEGYTSIGCAPCTRPTAAGESERAGRWWWEADELRECGLHHRSAASQRLDLALAEVHARAAAGTATATATTRRTA